MEEYLLEQELRNAFVRATHIIDRSIQVRDRKQLTPDMFSVEFLLDGGVYSIQALAVLHRNFFTLYLDAMSIHTLLTMPALQQYTVDHPWIVGV